MYPQLMAASSRLAPILSRLMSRGAASAFSPLGRTSQIDVPGIDPSKVTPLDNPQAAPKGPSVPISGPQDIKYPEPVKYPWAEDPMTAGGPPSAPYPMGTDPMTAGGPPQPAAPSYAAPDPTRGNNTVPLPMARPAEAPQPEPDTGFFMRNALMMQDPVNGGFIDPTGAASVRGPDLISKMMKYLHDRS